MNLKDSIQKLINNVNDESKELAVIFTTYTNQYDIKEFIPIKVLSGKYDDQKKAFIAENGVPYYHLIDVMEGEGFMYRASLDVYRKSFPNMPELLIKKLFLLNLKKYRFNLALSNDGIPLIMTALKNSNSVGVAVLDIEMLAFYETFYPEFYNHIIMTAKGNEIDFESVNSPSKNENEFVMKPINIQELYNEVTSVVIDQNEPIEKILTAIWKQYNDFDSNKARNILIYGKPGVGKTEIFRIITKNLGIPCAIVNATQYTAVGYVGDSVSDMLVAVLNNANGDIEKAQRGILIIDEIDKLAEVDIRAGQVNKKDVQEALLKLIEDGTFYIKPNNQSADIKIKFRTNNLLVIGMGSFSGIDLTTKNSVGFNSEQKNKTYKEIGRKEMIANGIIPELIRRFPIIVQMNELNKESFIKILKNPKSSILAKNINFFDKKGIKLLLQKGTIDRIAEEALKFSELGASSLDEIVETALSRASFEIAMHPNEYEELVITPETINDNKVYRLVRRKSDE